MVRKTNKTTQVFDYLRNNKEDGITSLEAIVYFGATRLSAIIFNLRKAGHNIETVMCEGTDRFGHPMRFARYYFRDSPTQDGVNEL